MAIKWLPTLSAPTTFFVRSKKYCLKMFGSSVLPDLLETMNRVVANVDLIFERLDLCRIGGIEHMQGREIRNPAEGHPQNFRAKLEPPIPSRRMSLKPGLNFFRRSS